MARVASAIYANSILRTGKKVKWLEALARRPDGQNAPGAVGQLQTTMLTSAGGRLITLRGVAAVEQFDDPRQRQRGASTDGRVGVGWRPRRGRAPCR